MKIKLLTLTVAGMFMLSSMGMVVHAEGVSTTKVHTPFLLYFIN